MRYKGVFVCGLLAIFLAAGSTANLAFPFGFSAEQKDTMNLQTFVVSDFGDSEDIAKKIIWKPVFSRFAKPADPTKVMSEPDTNACRVIYIKAQPLGLPALVSSNQNWSLGIKAQFIRKSYNWIELIPHKVATGIDSTPDTPPDPYAYTGEGVVANPIELPGVVKSLDMWVWGGNYNYWLEFYLQDYQGFIHRLNAGYINYVGWKNLRTKVPEYIKQAQFHVPFLKPLKLTKIKLWSTPTERVDQFYAYFDYMQVQTDVYIERFNGDDLAFGW